VSLPLVGELALWVALLFAAWGLVTSAAAGPVARTDLAVSGHRAIHAAGVMSMLALLALATSLFRHDFTLAYVAAFGGVTAPPRELITALWAAPPGALLVLAVAMSAVAALVATDDEPVVSAALHLLLLGALATVLGSESPFERLPYLAGDGRGLPPQLRDAVSLLAWPVWAAATTAAAASFALATASALHAAARRGLAVRSHRWALGAWVLHSAALLLAIWWSYRMPSGDQTWLARALHPTVTVAWLALGVAAHLPAIERRWTMRVRGRLTILALPLPLLLISAMRGAEGGWQPLHELLHGVGGAWWIVLVVALLQVTVYAFVRAPRAPLPVDGRAVGFESAGGGEAGIAGALRGGRLGSRLSHAGIAIALVGLAAGVASRERTLVLDPGATSMSTDAMRRDWRIVYQGLSTGEERTPLGEVRWRELLLPVAIASEGGGAGRTLLVPEIREYVDVFGRPTAPPWPRPAIHHGVVQDIVIEPDSIGDGEGARVRVAFVPLPGLVWVGGLAVVLGGALALAGERR
jgi:hypothetical protein